MNPALILVDLQKDYLERGGLVPPPAQITRGVPVAHVRTVIRADGRDRMPHWVRSDTWQCVEGTPRAEPPDAVRPAAGETVVRKAFFSGFGNPLLDEILKRLGTDTVIVAGIYLHGCVRSTVLDAYERGYEVWVAQDATGSTEPEHTANSQAWLGARAATFMPVAEIIARLDARVSARAGAP